MDFETIARVNELRRKGILGTLTKDDMIEGVRLLRQDRKSAHVASATARKSKAAVEIPDADDLLRELGGM